jgi:hypothetical protein
MTAAFLPPWHLCKSLKGIDALLVEDVAAAQKNLVLAPELFAADDALAARVLPLAALFLNFLQADDAGQRQVNGRRFAGPFVNAHGDSGGH